MNTTDTISNITLDEALRNAKEANPEGRNPTFRTTKYRFTLAKDDSANPGYVYIKDQDYSYVGKISPTGEVTAYQLDSAEKEYIQAVWNHPETTALVEGKATGICCCCGRTLTNPLSVELGIGPICRGYYFPPEPSTQVDALEDLEELDSTPLDDALDIMDELITPKPTDSPVLETSNFITDLLSEDALEVSDVVDAFKRFTKEQQLQVVAQINLHVMKESV